MNNVKIIEMCGLPGCGKTTILNSILPTNRTNILVTSQIYEYGKELNRGKKIIKIIFFIIKNVRLINYLFIYSLQCSSFKRYCELLRFFLVYNEMIVQNEKNNYSTIIIDQGLIQFIWSLNSKENKSNESNYKILRYICNEIKKLYDIEIIFLNIDYKIAAKRSSLRKSNSPFDRVSYHEKIKLYQIHASDFYNIFKCFDQDINTIRNQSEFYNILSKMMIEVKMR